MPKFVFFELQSLVLLYISVVYSVLLFRSDVDLPDVTGRLNVMCRRPLIFISRQGLYIEVFINI